MATESVDGVDPAAVVLAVGYAESPDGLVYGHVTPFLMPTAGQVFLYLGAAARASWDGNSIARAVMVLPEPFDPAVRDR